MNKECSVCEVRSASFVTVYGDLEFHHYQWYDHFYAPLVQRYTILKKINRNEILKTLPHENIIS